MSTERRTAPKFFGRGLGASALWADGQRPEHGGQGTLGNQYKELSFAATILGLNLAFPFVAL